MLSRVEVALTGVLLASCTAIPETAERLTPRPSPIRAPVSDGASKVGAAYSIGGQRYVPADVRAFEQIGLASWYGDELRGQRTANGEAFDPDGISAAHPTLPLPSYVEITSLDTGRTILARINDRGPFHSNRILDMSFGAARQLGITGHGARPIRIRRVDPPEQEKAALRRGERVAERAMASGEALAAWRAGIGWRAPVVATTTIPGGSGPLYLQIASFSSLSRAQAMATRLGAQISTVGGIHRVRMGPFFTASEANAALAPLAAKGYPDVRITR